MKKLIALLTLSTICGGAFAASEIDSLKSKIAVLKSGLRLPAMNNTWKIFQERIEENELEMKYAHEGYGDKKYSPSDIIQNDYHGYRRVIVTGEPTRLLSSIGMLQQEVPIEVLEFRINQSDYGDEMDLIVKVRGTK